MVKRESQIFSGEPVPGDRLKWTPLISLCCSCSPAALHWWLRTSNEKCHFADSVPSFEIIVAFNRSSGIIHSSVCFNYLALIKDHRIIE